MQTKKFLKSHSDQTKILLISGICVHFFYVLFFMKNYTYLLDQYGLSAFIGRTIGTFLGMYFPALIVSAIISFLPYKIFKDVAEKYKKYLDYYAIIFLIISFIIIFSSIKTQNILNGQF